MRTLEERLIALSDDLLARTTAIDPDDCVADARADLAVASAPIGARRRVLVGVLALGVVLAATGGVYALTRHDAAGVRIETTVPSSAATTVAPTTTVPAPTASEFAAALPDCVPVSDTRGQTRGCVLKSQLMGRSADNDNVPPGMPGLPVYSEDGGRLVGYEVQVVGFVPLSIGDDPAAMAHLTTCVTLLTNGTLDGSPEESGCVPTLVAYGIPDPVKSSRLVTTDRARESAAVQQYCRTHPAQARVRPRCLLAGAGGN
jgi:hypothetical protein